MYIIKIKIHLYLCCKLSDNFKPMWAKSGQFNEGLFSISLKTKISLLRNNALGVFNKLFYLNLFETNLNILNFKILSKSNIFTSTNIIICLEDIKIINLPKNHLTIAQSVTVNKKLKHPTIDDIRRLCNWWIGHKNRNFFFECAVCGITLLYLNSLNEFGKICDKLN